MTIQRKRGFAAFVGALSVAALLNACGEDLEQITNSDKITAVSYKDLAECNKSNEGKLAYVKDSNAVYLCADKVWKDMYTLESDESDGKDGQKGANGASCTVSALKDGSGYDVLCGGKKVGKLLSAEDGEKGSKGDKGTKGDTGDKGNKGADGTDCKAESLKGGSGYKLSCGDKVIGTIENGKNGEKGADGASCSAKSLKDGSGFEISCGGKVVGTLKNGTSHTGVGCSFEEDGDGLIVAKCGDDTKGVKLYKAVCGTTPYEPAEYACLDIEVNEKGSVEPVLAPLCSGKPYNPIDPKIDSTISSRLRVNTIQVCKEGVIFGICDGEEFNPESKFCVVHREIENNKTTEKLYSKCGGKTYKAEYFSSCKDGVIYYACGEGEYNIETQFCSNDGTGDKAYDKCRGNVYDVTRYLCKEDTPYGYCGDDVYNLETQFCATDGSKYKPYDLCEGEKYDVTMYLCVNDSIYAHCGTNTYNVQTQVCHVSGFVYEKCGEDYYNEISQFCAENKVYARCGSEKLSYNPQTEVCKDGKVLTKCGEDGYDPATHFCGANNQIAELCGTDHKDYDPETQKCDENGVVLTKCGSTYFDSKEKKCVNGYVENRTFCGDEEYDVKTHFCDKRDNHPYKKFLLYFAGKKPRYEYYWMAEDLDHDMGNGSALYNETRYYSWETAQDACPNGWHLPTKAEFENLISRTGGSEIAGKNLKSVDGWSKASNGTVALDSYGFGAKASGYLYLLDWPGDTQTLGLYVSATDEGDSVYVLELHHDSDAAVIKLWPKKDKDGYFMKYPVRCMLRVKS